MKQLIPAHSPDTVLTDRHAAAGSCGQDDIAASGDRRRHPLCTANAPSVHANTLQIPQYTTEQMKLTPSTFYAVP